MNKSVGASAEETELVFVYKARSDLFSRVTDFAHKVISPKTYSCSLCRLTHGHLGMHREWAAFVQSFPMKVSFRYQDQVESHPQEDLPQVWLRQGSDRHLLIGADELNAVPSLEALMELIKKRLKD